MKLVNQKKNYNGDYKSTVVAGSKPYKAPSKAL